MATTYDWVKMMVENSKSLLLVIVVLTSTLGFTVNEGMVLADEVKLTKQQVTLVAQHLTRSSKCF